VWEVVTELQVSQHTVRKNTALAWGKVRPSAQPARKDKTALIVGHSITFADLIDNRRRPQVVTRTTNLYELCTGFVRAQLLPHCVVGQVPGSMRAIVHAE
jgi:hypothetical protein